MKQPVILFLLFLFQSSYGQDYLPMQNLTSKDGLSYRDVYGVCQDSFGFMWIATTNGLNRYDGVEWVVYKHSDQDSTSLPDNSVQWVMEEGTGNLLLGTKGRIIYFDRRTERFRPARWLIEGKSVDYMGVQPFRTPDDDYRMPVIALKEKRTFLLRYLGNGQFGEAVPSKGSTNIYFYSSFVYPAELLSGATNRYNRYWYRRPPMYSGLMGILFGRPPHQA